MEIGTPELLIILAIVILIFGIGRIGKIGTELGQGIRAFREGLNGPKERKESSPDKTEAEIPKPPSNEAE